MLEPEIEKPAKKKSEPEDFTIPDESDNEFHDSIKQQESDIEVNDFFWPIYLDDKDS